MPTPAQLYEDVLWESARLEPNELLVCLCHAKHAYRDGLPVDFSWVTADRLMECTKLSRGAVIKAKRAALPVPGSATSLVDAEAHARLAELLARGRAARERRECRKAARRRSVQSAEVFGPTLWGQREAALRRAQWCWPKSPDGREVGSVLEDTTDTACRADHEGRALSESGTR